jgi:DNA-binding transcriptional LysR family regulator
MIGIMLTTHTERVDLNLLTPLVALLEERQVSRAALRVGLSQPAMSRALQRLRRVLDDPLLVRDPDGFRLSARAENIYGQLSTVIPLLENLLSPNDFDPNSASQPVTLSGSDYAVILFAPAICRQVRAQSPNSPVRFRNLRLDGIIEHIRSGAVDLGLYGGSLPQDLQSAVIFVEEFACVMAADHPLAGHTRITLTEYLRYPHLVIDTADGIQTAIDGPLTELGSPRAAAVTVPYHSAATVLLTGSDLIATLPARLGSGWTGDEKLSVLPAPKEIATMPYQMIWNRAFDNDRRHQWLRGVVQAATTP